MYAIPAWIIVRIIYYLITKKSFDWKNEMLWLAFFLYSVCVVTITIVPLPFTRYKPSNAEGINLVPVRHTLAQFKAIMDSGREHFLKNALLNILGNVLLFVPLGFFLPVLVKFFRSFVLVFFTAFFISIGIEIIQYASSRWGIYRSSDIDDIILNTLGGMIGYFIYKITRKKTSDISGKDLRMQH